jgi:hypothetical protein
MYSVHCMELHSAHCTEAKPKVPNWGIKSTSGISRVKVDSGIGLPKVMCWSRLCSGHKMRLKVHKNEKFFWL